MNDEQRIRLHTEVVSAPLCPELKLHLVTERCPAFRMTEAQAASAGLVEPYWAFCWPGGQALSRHLLDHPEIVRGKRVLDFGAGCAVEALAALRSGATAVVAADIDPLAGVAARLNAALNDLPGPLLPSADVESGRAEASFSVTDEDLIGTLPDCEVVLAGDVFYDRELARRGLAWLTTLARSGLEVLIGDPSRGFLDLSGLELVRAVRAHADGDLGGAVMRETGVYRIR